MAGRGSAIRPWALALLLACWSAGARCEPAVLSIPDAQLEPLIWRQLPGWSGDDQARAFAVFRKSCAAIVARKTAPRAARPFERSLAAVCRAALTHGHAGTAAARAFFEAHFRPVAISPLGKTNGFLTGYYEPVVHGSRVPTAEFTVPVYRRPPDLIATVKQADLTANRIGAFRRDDDNRLVPYYTRAEIEDGALAGKGLEICWLKDPVDAFFIQIQGSARVRLEDGAMLRLNFDGRNGYPYTSVGRVLIDRGEVPKEEMSMARIRAWMHDHPEAAKELRRQNRAFVFFRTTALGDNEEAIGGEGVPLTAGRSLAIDHRLYAYGMPFWIDAALPLASATARDPFRRLMIAQDTGSAITGPARADIYFGGGDEAGRIAGRIQHPGRFVMLVPRGIALTAPAPWPRHDHD